MKSNIIYVFRDRSFRFSNNTSIMGKRRLLNATMCQQMTLFAQI